MRRRFSNLSLTFILAVCVLSWGGALRADSSAPTQDAFVSPQGPVSLRRSPVTRNQVAEAVPESLRGDHYASDLASEKSPPADGNIPGGANANFSFILKKYAAYVTDSRLVTDQLSSGRESSDGTSSLADSAEFTIYALAGLELAKKAIGKDGFRPEDFEKLRKFVKEEAEHVGHYLKAADGHPKTGVDKARALYAKLLSSPEAKSLRDFISQELGDEWVKTVLGPNLSQDQRRLHAVDRSRELAAQGAENGSAGDVESTTGDGGARAAATEGSGAGSAAATGDRTAHGAEGSAGAPTGKPREKAEERKAETDPNKAFEKDLWDTLKAMMPEETETDPKAWEDAANTAIEISHFMNPDASERASEIIKALGVKASSPNYKLFRTFLELKGRLKDSKGIRELVKMLEGSEPLPKDLNESLFRKDVKAALDALVAKKENKPWIDLLTAHRHPVLDPYRALYQVKLRRELAAQEPAGWAKLAQILTQEKYSLTTAQRKKIAEDLKKIKSESEDAVVLSSMKHLYGVAGTDLYFRIKDQMDEQDKKAKERATAWTNHLHEADPAWREAQKKKYGEDHLLRWELSKVISGENIEVKATDPKKMIEELRAKLPKDSELWHHLALTVPEALSEKGKTSAAGGATETKTIVAGDDRRYYLHSRLEALPVKGEVDLGKEIKVKRMGPDAYQICTSTYCSGAKLTRAEVVEKAVEAERRASTSNGHGAAGGEKSTSATGTTGATGQTAAGQTGAGATGGQSTTGSQSGQGTKAAEVKTDPPQQLHRVASLQDLDSRIKANQAKGIKSRVMFAAQNCGPCQGAKPGFKRQAETDGSMRYYLYEISDYTRGIPELAVRAFPDFRTY